MHLQIPSQQEAVNFFDSAVTTVTLLLNWRTYNDHASHPPIHRAINLQPHPNHGAIHQITMTYCLAYRLQVCNEYTDNGKHCHGPE